MDYVPSTAAVAAAAQKSSQDDAAVLAKSIAVASIQPKTLDPRPAYTLSPGTADAMLSLADQKTHAVSAVEFEARYVRASQITEAAAAVVTAPIVSPEPAKAVSAANRNWIEDVRLDHMPTRKIGSDTVIQYSDSRVIAAWRAAFPDVTGRKFRGLMMSDTDVKPVLDRLKAESGLGFNQKNIYLVCNDANYRVFSNDHPDTHINWIAVDSDDILLLWPKADDRQDEDVA